MTEIEDLKRQIADLNAVILTYVEYSTKLLAKIDQLKGVIAELQNTVPGLGLGSK